MTLKNNNPILPRFFPSLLKHTRSLWILGSLLALSHCSSVSIHSQGNTQKLALETLEGKKIALFEITGPKTAQKIVEVALVNVLIRKGYFILLPKPEVEHAKHPETLHIPTALEVGKSVKADYVLRMHILKFDAQTTQGYERKKVYDSLLEQERGEEEATDIKTIPIQIQKAEIALRLTFQSTQDGSLFERTTELSQTEKKSALHKAIHLTPKLVFLSKLTEKLLNQFFQNFSSHPLSTRPSL